MSRIQEVQAYFQAGSDLAVFLDGARRFAAHMKSMQARWEAGHYGDDEVEHVAKLTKVFVDLVDAFDTADKPKLDMAHLLLSFGKFVPSRELFNQAESQLSRQLFEKYGSPENYRWCIHGFVHGIDCPEGCTEGTIS